MPVADTNSRLAATTVPRHLWAKGTSEPFTGQENPRFFCRGKRCPAARASGAPSSYESTTSNYIVRVAPRWQRLTREQTAGSLMKRRNDRRMQRRRTSTKRLEGRSVNRAHGSVNERGKAQHRLRCFSMGAKCLAQRVSTGSPLCGRWKRRVRYGSAFS